MKKIISRKKFLATTAAGLAAMKLLPQAWHENDDDISGKRSIGKTGIMASAVCFGASRTNQESLIRYVISKGINFLDTGRSYANGNNERLVGRAVSGIRKNILIQSKLKLDTHELPSGGKGAGADSEIQRVLQGRLEESLNALNTDYIDILLYHSADDEDLLFHPGVIRFFEEKKKSGVIRAHGFSAHNENMDFFDRNNRELFYDVLMVPFNYKGSLVHSITGEYTEWDHNRLTAILEEAGKKGTGIIAMKTCSAGKYALSPGSGGSFAEAVRWVIAHPFVSSAAVAMASFEQVNEHFSIPGEARKT